MLDQLKKDLLEARKVKDAVKVALLSTLVAEVEKISKDVSNADITVGRIHKIIGKFIDNAREIAKYAETKSEEMLAKAQREVEILEVYLPKLMTEDEIRAAIDAALDELGRETNIGSVMQWLKKKYEGLFDGKKASEIVKEVLGL